MEGSHMQTPEDSDKTRGEFELTRRGFILIAGTAAVAAAALPHLSKAQTAAPTDLPPTPLTKVAFHVNGKLHEVEVDNRTTLLDALQQSTVDGIQLVKLHTDQAFEVTAEVKPVTTEGSKTPGRPAASKEKITLYLDAKDTSLNPGGEQIYKFKDTLAHTPYFVEQRISTNQIQLKTLATPQLDNETGKPYVTFTLECVFPDRVR